jgi:rsbT co-antagonist protein RsbR
MANKTKEQLQQELAAAQQRIAELERAVDQGSTDNQDLTEQKEVERKLRESERWLHLITTNVPMVIFAIDKDGIFTMSEGKGLVKLGLEPGQVVGQSAFDVYRDVPQICDEIRQCLTGETVTSNVIMGPLVLQTMYSPILDENNEITGLIGVSVDMSETRQAEIEREKLQQEVIDAQQRAIAELSTPVIPIMDRIIVMPMVGSIDSMRARDITRALLAGIGHHRAKVVILDVTGVSLMDTGIVNHLNKTIQAARLKGARTIVTGISDAVAESIVDLGIDWSEITTLSDLQTGLLVALEGLSYELVKKA